MSLALPHFAVVIRDVLWNKGDARDEAIGYRYPLKKGMLSEKAD
jgi:hypothetical protein